MTHKHPGRNLFSDSPNKPLERELTIEQLVTFGDQAPMRLPVALIHAIAALRTDCAIVGRAKVVMGQQDNQAMVAVTVKAPPGVFGSRALSDTIYEAIEATDTPKLMVRCHLVEENTVKYRLLDVEASGLRDAATLPEGTRPDEDEVWLLTSVDDLVVDNIERTEELIEQWQAEEGIKGTPRFEKVRASKLLVDRTIQMHGIELPGAATREQAQAIATRLCQAHGGIKIYTELVLKDYFPLPIRHTVSLFEDVRDMAKRLRETKSNNS